MSAYELPESLEVPVVALAELAVEYWRLKRWLSHHGATRSSVVVRHVARGLEQFLDAEEITTMDLTNQSYEPGLAVDVVDRVVDDATLATEPVIAEVLSPIVLWRARVVAPGQVVIRHKHLDAGANSDEVSEK